MFASIYARFRGSPWFLGSLLVVVAGWLGWNHVPFLPHVDFLTIDGLNLFLSIEASGSVALLIMDSERADRRAEAQSKAIHDLLKAAVAILKNLDRGAV